MNSVTEFLKRKAPHVFRIVPEVSDPTGRFSMIDDGGVEVEVGELLYGFIRVLKPHRVLTTGVYTGVSDSYIAQALVDNGEIFPDGYGRSKVIEFEAYHMQRASELWAILGVDLVIGKHFGKSLEFQPDQEYDFIFLDTEPDLRFQELVKFYPYLKDGGYVFIHDLHRHLSQTVTDPSGEHPYAWPFGELPDQIKQWLQTGYLKNFNFPTPRGLAGFYKPKGDDYRA